MDRFERMAGAANDRSDLLLAQQAEAEWLRMAKKAKAAGRFEQARIYLKEAEKAMAAFKGES